MDLLLQLHCCLPEKALTALSTIPGRKFSRNIFDPGPWGQQTSLRSGSGQRIGPSLPLRAKSPVTMTHLFFLLKVVLTLNGHGEILSTCKTPNGRAERRRRQNVLTPSNRAGGNGHKLKAERNPLKHQNPSCFTTGAVERWYRLPKKVVESPLQK